MKRYKKWVLVNGKIILNCVIMEVAALGLCGLEPGVCLVDGIPSHCASVPKYPDPDKTRILRAVILKNDILIL